MPEARDRRPSSLEIKVSNNRFVVSADLFKSPTPIRACSENFRTSRLLKKVLAILPDA